MHIHGNSNIGTMNKVEYIGGPNLIIGWYICTYADISKQPIFVDGPYISQGEAVRLLHESKGEKDEIEEQTHEK